MKTEMTHEQPVPLPTEIIFEILLRLPVKSLLRCKSVCKLWLSLISDPHFIKSHLKLSSSLTTNAHRRLIFNDGLGIIIKGCPLNDVLFEKSVVNSLDLLCPSHPLQRCVARTPRIVGSCNGLVCIVCFHYEGDMLFIWNPSTKLSTGFYFTFGVPPAMRYNVVYGFAYDKDNDDYRVVAVSRCDRYQVMNQYEVRIYSLKTGSWKQIGVFPYGYPVNYGCPVNMSSIFLNGFLHWMATPIEDSEPTYPCTIVYLDIASETYGEVSQPVYDEDDKVLTLGTLGEWLCVLCNYPTFADVWVMKVYGVQDSWTKLASVTYQTGTLSSYYDRPLFIAKDGTILLQSGWDLVVCDSNDGSSSKVINFDGCFDVTTFVESLVSPICRSALDNRSNDDPI